MANSEKNELVATLIAGSGSKLTPEFVAELAHGQRVEWLSENEAADIFDNKSSADEWRAELKKIIGDQNIDVIVQSTVTRRKKLLAADMESTIIEQELLDELAGEIGMRDQVSEITRRAMNGEIDFAAALRARVALLEGQPIAVLEKVAKKITYMPGAARLVATMKGNGAQTWLITGGFMYFAKPVAALVGFDQCQANDLIIKDGVITGEAFEPILDRFNKKTQLEKACAENKLDMSQTLAVGDGANDVPMLSACNEGGGLGIAYRAKPKVREVIPHHINFGHLTALLYAQGYKKSEFVS